MKKKLENCAFIDSQNLNLGVRSQGWKLDFGKFRQYLITKYNVKKTFLFIGYIRGNQSLYTYLQSVGYICIFKPTLELKEDKNEVKVKGNVDAELVLHAMIEYQNYDTAIIITGDGDFYCLVDYLNKKGKLLKLLIPNVHKYSKLLRPFAPNKIDFMNNLKNKLEHKKREPIA